jgi:hypothetical protein
LTCNRCKNLTKIDGLPNVITLTCMRCSRLTEIDGLPNLVTLRCGECNLLQSINGVPDLKYLYCDRCHALKDVAIQSRLRALNCNNSRAMVLPRDNDASADVDDWCAAWREKGLMPHAEQGVLVWKHVNSGMVGYLGFQYELGQQFECTGMACAGPFGTVRRYDHSRGTDEPSYMIAIRATCLYPVDAETGIFHAFRGTPVAFYQAMDITDDGFTPILLKGQEDDQIRKIWAS